MSDAVYGGTGTKVTSNGKTVAATGQAFIRRIIFTNGDGAARYLQTFDALTDDVTVGTTQPSMVYACPAGDSRVISLNKKYTTGLVFAVTTTPSGSTGPTECWVEVIQ